MKEQIFDEILSTFENDDIKEFASQCIKTIDPYFYEVPASSSLKYHPSYACTIPLGLAKHTVALCKFLNYMFEVESIGSQFTSRERDLLRVAGIAHDTMKSGSQEDYEHNHYTKFNHPLLAAKKIQEIDGLSKEEKIFIGRAIASHMGQYNTDKRHPDVILPKPQTKYEIILHLADYLASRKDIEMKFDSGDEPSVERPEKYIPDINTYKLTFGKHSGKTIPEIAAEDPGYIRWAKENLGKQPIKSLLENYEV